MSVPTTSTTRPDRPRGFLPLAAIGLATVMQLIVAVPFTIGLGLLAPLPAIVVAWVLWVAAAVLLVVVARRRPLLTPVIPIVNAGLLAGLVTFGDLVLGWTA